MCCHDCAFPLRRLDLGHDRRNFGVSDVGNPGLGEGELAEKGNAEIVFTRFLFGVSIGGEDRSQVQEPLVTDLFERHDIGIEAANRISNICGFS